MNLEEETLNFFSFALVTPLPLLMILTHYCIGTVLNSSRKGGVKMAKFAPVASPPLDLP